MSLVAVPVEIVSVFLPEHLLKSSREVALDWAMRRAVQRLEFHSTERKFNVAIFCNSFEAKHFVAFRGVLRLQAEIALFWAS